jgi:hypothetical protein
MTEREDPATETPGEGRVPQLPGEEEDAMIQVVLEVRTGAARFRVTARAQSIRRAVSIVGSTYPHGEVRMTLPVGSGSFFSEDASDKVEPVGLGRQ